MPHLVTVLVLLSLVACSDSEDAQIVDASIVVDAPVEPSCVTPVIPSGTAPSVRQLFDRRIFAGSDSNYPNGFFPEAMVLGADGVAVLTFEAEMVITDRLGENPRLLAPEGAAWQAHSAASNGDVISSVWWFNDSAHLCDIPWDRTELLETDCVQIDYGQISKVFVAPDGLTSVLAIKDKALILVQKQGDEVKERVVRAAEAEPQLLGFRATMSNTDLERLDVLVAARGETCQAAYYGQVDLDSWEIELSPLRSGTQSTVKLDGYSAEDEVYAHLTIICEDPQRCIRKETHYATFGPEDYTMPVRWEGVGGPRAGFFLEGKRYSVQGFPRGDNGPGDFIAGMEIREIVDGVPSLGARLSGAFDIPLGPLLWVSAASDGERAYVVYRAGNSIWMTAIEHASSGEAP